jgi:hypothetical protein
LFERNPLKHKFYIAKKIHADTTKHTFNTSVSKTLLLNVKASGTHTYHRVLKYINKPNKDALTYFFHYSWQQ